MTQLVQLLNEFGGWLVRHLGRLSLELVVLAAVVFVVIEVYRRAAEYANSLTRVAETKAGLTRRLLLNTFAAAESNFAGRVRRILKGKRRATLGLSALSVGALIVIACFGLPTAARKAAQVNL